MSFIKDIAKKRREAESGEKEEVEMKGPLIKDILKDPQESPLFGKYLEANQHHELASRVVGHNLEDGDIESLAELRQGFLEAREMTKETKALLTQEMIDDIVVTSPELRRLVGIIDKKDMRDLVLGHLDEMAVANNLDFVLLHENTKYLDVVTKEISRNDEELQKLYKKYGISEADHKDFVESGDREEFEAIIKDKTWFARWRPDEVKRRVDSLDNRSHLEMLANAYNNNLSEMSAALGPVLLRKDAAGRSANAMVFGEQLKVTPDLSFSEAEKASRNLPKREEVRKQYAIWLKAKKDNDPHYNDAMNGPVDFADENASRYISKKTGGLWASILSSLFKKSVENMVN